MRGKDLSHAQYAGPDSVTSIFEKSNSQKAVDSVREALARAKAEADLNSFASINEALALKAAEAIDRQAGVDVPLRGVTLSIKDNIHVAGLPSTAGTPALKNHVPSDTSPVVRRLQNLGAVVLGKSNMHELAYGITSNNAWLGSVRNPLDKLYIAGGSSGGTAAAVASGIVTAGIGTDTGGSIRIPAALTGIVGFRPTVGTYSTDAVMVLSKTKDTVGIMTRSVRDASLLHSLIIENPNSEPRDLRSVRLGVPRRHFRENLDPDVERVFSNCLTRLEDAGANLIYADILGANEANHEASFAIVLWETSELLPAYLARYSPRITIEDIFDNLKSPDVSEIFQSIITNLITKEAYEHALNVARPTLKAAYQEYFNTHHLDAILLPTTPITAREIDGIDEGVWVNGERQDTFQAYIRNVDPASTAGLPAISVPAGLTAGGLAVGIELECLPGADNALLAIATEVEKVFLGDR
jgi:mandelamide amidase